MTDVNPSTCMLQFEWKQVKNISYRFSDGINVAEVTEVEFLKQVKSSADEVGFVVYLHKLPAEFSFFKVAFVLLSECHQWSAAPISACLRHGRWWGLGVSTIPESFPCIHPSRLDRPRVPICTFLTQLGIIPSILGLVTCAQPTVPLSLS